MNKTGKTVYILGAGASKAAGLPLQAELLPLIYSIKKDNDINSFKGSLFEIPSNHNLDRLWEYYPLFEASRRKIARFILQNFASQEKCTLFDSQIMNTEKIIITDYSSGLEKEKSLMKAYSIVKEITVSLEDIFTIFDNVQLRHEHFKSYTQKQIEEYNNDLKLCIVYALTYAIVNSKSTEIFQQFSEKLIKKRIADTLQEDTFSIITMNWDGLLEKILDESCRSYNKSLTPHQQKIFIDLCFYNYDLILPKDHIPYTHIKAKGNKNIKILKMHGSLGWLQCPKCGRVYTDLNKDIANDEYKKIRCPKCSEENLGVENEEYPQLRNMLITPTFLKSLDNLCVKNIWHNAYLELNEAARIVFIGYSFPEADFEMRCLLKKAINNNTQLEVVLHESDDPEKYYQQLKSTGMTDDEIKKIISKIPFPQIRYLNFFGDGNIKFNYRGFSTFVEEL